MNKNIASYEYALKNTLNSTSNSNELDWFKSIEKKDFKSALDILEKKSELSVHEKLWWIRSQLNLKLLPASTLVSPLEQVYEKITEENKTLAASTYLATCQSLINKKQSRLSVLTSKRAFELLKDPSIAQIYKDCLKNEIAEAREKKQTTSYISELETELENLEKNNLASTNKYTLGAETSATGGNRSLKSNETTNKEVTLKEVAQEKIAQKATSKQKKSFPFGYILAGLFFILLGLSYNFIFTKEQNHLARLDYNIKVPQPLSPKILPSEIEAQDTKQKEIKGDKQTNNLENNLETVEKRITSLNTNVEDENLENRIEDTAEENDTPDNYNEKVISKAEDYSEEIDLEPIPKEKIPDITKNRPSRPELIDQSPKRVESRRVSPSLPSASKGIKAYNVEEFDPPLKYKTITSTEVLSSPSLLSNSLARLKLDTHVLVTKKLGLWLEIRSTQGRIGYIYAQDASEI